VNLWHIKEDMFNPAPKNLHSQETVYCVGNGYFCTRGTFEEGYPGATPATLLFGVFDAVPVYKEELANAPDWLPVGLRIGGELFRLDRGNILSYQRILDMQNGLLTRSVEWESPRGVRLRISSERIASLADEHVGAERLRITSDQANSDTLELALWSNFNLAVGNYDLMHWEALDSLREDDLVCFQTTTKKSGVQLAQTMSFAIDAPDFRREYGPVTTAPSIELYGTIAPGETKTVEKVVVMYTSRDGVEPAPAALKHHKEIPGTGADTFVFDDLLARSKEAWRQFWQGADVIIEGDEKAQLGIRYNIYQLRISASLHDDRYSIAAKGLTGFGYRGHIFHDTEIFMLPFYTYVMPDVARNLLIYRWRTLPAARQKAQRNGYQGAQFAWESASTGEETTPDSMVHPELHEVIPVLNARLEIHITASIAHATWHYWLVTGDNDFLRDYGAEVILSAAIFWESRVEKNEQRRDYEITNVIGPDEWHEHVNNNTFTNYMARHNLQIALDVWDFLQANAPAKYEELKQRLAISQQRLDHWQDIIARMLILQDPRTRLIEQFEGFFKLEPFDQSRYAGRKDSYQGILGMEDVQKYQIIKQADVLMLLTVLRQEFDLETKRVNWDYYYPITDHEYGSSLTPAFHVILACELDKAREAKELFRIGNLVDLENLRGNTPDGIHNACSGAAWQAAALGFAGLKVTADGYTTDPRWPDGWTRLAFTIKHRGKSTPIDLRR
jgi:trehalose/maltose hydrolase-like predicted phosphorylase